MVTNSVQNWLSGLRISVCMAASENGLTRVDEVNMNACRFAASMYLGFYIDCHAAACSTYPRVSLLSCRPDRIDLIIING
ncbi:hypothetical protein F2P45_01330 [Massilia sp. CCM 8733]|uniref:Uncharacterized protein n=1 Tax=Massilia mucilaginosa TaxID=2609282 RepID=A0ABX0NLJ3_9BURK|nr:hypothetical protein [Massilia mucilaginosa]NHZ87678.1 hypothetical protein [Massilia mucilaginosa]